MSTAAMNAPELVSAKPKTYPRPDIVVLSSIRGSADTIREELKEIGDERRYATALRVMETQAKLIATLSRELLDRFERSGVAL